MLSADLYFYPDARWASDGTRIGLLLFLYSEKGPFVGFVPSVDLGEAQSQAQDPVLLGILNSPGEYVSRSTSSIGTRIESERGLADAVASVLPHNFRVMEPEPWPPEKLGEKLAELVSATALGAHQITIFPAYQFA